jgi:hypothetical protein
VTAWGPIAEAVAGAAATVVAGRAVLRTARAAAPAPPATAGTPEPGPPTTLARAERAARARLASDVHLRLRPLLAEIAAERLRAHGVDLEHDGAAARDLLGDALWDLVRPDRPPPEDGLARAVETEDVAALLDRLEAI